MGRSPLSLAHFPWCFYVKNFHPRRKTRYKTSDNFSAENIVLVKSADPITKTFQNPSQFCHIGQEERTGAITAGHGEFQPWGHTATY